MPVFDFACPTCGLTVKDVYLHTRSDLPPVCQKDQQPMAKVWLQQANSVIGDEIDVEVRHALCWPNGRPRRFRSREELNRVAKKKGYTNYVEHKSGKSGDRSKHTQRWI